MSNKHITIKELNNEQSYDTLYPNTSATQVPLSAATSQLFGQTGLNADAALYKIIEKLRTDKKITVIDSRSTGPEMALIVVKLCQPEGFAAFMLKRVV